MVSTEEEITRRLSETDSVRKARRAQAATTIGQLARRHIDLAGQLAELERELGQVLTAAGDVIDVPELAQVTDVPAADLARWREQAVKPARRRKRPDGGKDTAGGSPRSSSAATVVRVEDPAGS
jgi:hypothetical protein